MIHMTIYICHMYMARLKFSGLLGSLQVLQGVLKLLSAVPLAKCRHHRLGISKGMVDLVHETI